MVGDCGGRLVEKGICSYKKADAGHRLLAYTEIFKLVELERVPYETPRGLLWLSSASLVHQIDIRSLKH